MILIFFWFDKTVVGGARACEADSVSFVGLEYMEDDWMEWCGCGFIRVRILENVMEGMDELNPASFLEACLLYHTNQMDWHAKS